VSEAERVCVVGLGYVGLPLAVEFARSGLDTVGFDIDSARTGELDAGIDRNGTYSAGELSHETLRFTFSTGELGHRTCFVIAVPTPVTADKRPNLTALHSACAEVGSALRPGAMVVVESTVYPGVTRETCIPVLEAESGLRCPDHFQVAYSPERINPGDDDHRLAGVVKVVSGFDDDARRRAQRLYNRVVTAGVHTAPSIEAAELAKLVENCQRDINIAFINEVARYCSVTGVPLDEVLAASGSKWNFHHYQPGLVGGHCIPVDPHYLIEAMQKQGLDPKVLDAARSRNDAMASFVTSRILDAAGCPSPKVAVLGVTFKADIPDVRNTGSGRLISEMRRRGAEVVAHDPLCSKEAAAVEAGVELAPLDSIRDVDVLVLAVAHRDYQQRIPDLMTLVRPGGMVADLTHTLSSAQMPADLALWKL
jgi:UDP-N-acetyl-D-glucosamine/UDP-N-acetyl-D-galactosamine dehydrogenase